jgi:hypothetical protein
VFTKGMFIEGTTEPVMIFFLQLDTTLFSSLGKEANSKSYYTAMQ